MDRAIVLLNISAVERETGLSKDVLRVWERRYGFPKPGRDDNTERRYSPEQVAKLRVIKRLMDAGMRPGKLIHQALAELNALADAQAGPRREVPAPVLERDVLALVRNHNATALQHAFSHLLMRQGLQRSVLETLLPLNRAVSEALMRGELRVFEEHLYAELLQSALRSAINAFPRHPGSPTILLTTFPGEHHGLGLLMVEALLVPEGAQCISLGTQTPIDEIVRAAVALKAHIVVIGLTAAFPLRQAGDALSELRRHVPAATHLWACGEMTRRLRKSLPGVRLMPDLADAVGALRID
jgi:DNA-binding transcriptional MerR regulator/methylmalonyl-CoA mutase cobalamin-binding subunit